jgi:hypothetical protein
MLGLAGKVADMSRHVADDTPCRSNFGQMGPCRRHYSYVEIYYGMGVHMHIYSQRSFLSCSPFCHVLQFVMFWRVTTHTHTTPTIENTKTNSITHSIRDDNDGLLPPLIPGAASHHHDPYRRHGCRPRLSSIATAIILLPLSLAFTV